MKNLHIVLIVIMAFAVQSCFKPDRPTPTPTSGKSMDNLDVPYSFAYETTQDVHLLITDAQDYVKYSVYSISEAGEPEISYEDNDTVLIIDNSNQHLASGVSRNGQWFVELNLPAHQKYLYIKRFHNGTSYGQKIEIVNGEAHLDYMKNKSYRIVAQKDVLYAVTDKKQYISIDPETGAYEVLGSLSDHSYACAVDKENNRLYVAYKSGKKDLGYFDLTTGVYTFIGQLKKTMHRMDYNASEGLLYMGSGKYLYTYDPFNGQFISSYKLTGQNANKGYGDVAFNAEGILYLANQIAVYSVNLNGNNSAISPVSDALSFKAHSLVIDTEGLFWLTDHKKPAKIYTMDAANGDYSLAYQDFPFKIFDLAISLKDQDTQIEDADGDGVADDQDAYPNNPNRAFDSWVPGENIWGTLAFEDLWPAKGDFDFNDLVLSYKFHQITNSDNNVTGVEANFKVRHIGASYVNGFGFELPIDASQIASVSGYNITDDALSIASNGVEAGQSKAVAVLFDNANANLNQEMTLSVAFNSPIAPSVLGAAPYNPFIVVNQLRGFEVHLSDHTPTMLADLELFETLDDDSNSSENRYYKTDRNLPWAINIPVEFVWPLEKQAIINGYLKFAEWAESGGELFPDWYKDIDGYRENSFLDIQSE
ncbi:MAG: LruC domain-containing protein [Bacteroidales bacterium]|nr:LruC domain-containing protein [Bacteroidales bacterium]